MKNLRKPALVVLLLVASATAALADPITTTTLSDSTYSSVLTEYAFVAESRWGNDATNGDWEVGVGTPNTHDANYVDVGQLAWTSGYAEDFLLSYDGVGTLTYTVGGVTVSRSETLDGNGMLIRLAGGATYGTASITIDELNGSAVAPSTHASSGVLYLLWRGVDLSSAWSIGGAQTLTAGTSPRGSRPALQIKGGTIVPEPATLSLLGLGVGALALVRNRRRP